LPTTPGLAGLLPQLASPRIMRKFRESFTAGDIVDPLLSFDTDMTERNVARIMKSRRLGIVGIRVDGMVQGFVRLSDIGSGNDVSCGRNMQHITADQVLDNDAPLMDVVGILTRHDHCFVSMFDSVVGLVERDAVNKPVVRMWLFGAITLYEMELAKLIARCFPDDTWQDMLTPSRLEKTRELQRERERRNQHCELIDCLQLPDKLQILLEHPPVMETMGWTSKRMAKQRIKELESLRNHLAHSQNLVSHDWVQIIRITQSLAELGSQ
jgi:hypothetical protein